MAQFALVIRASLTARNLDSADKKMRLIKERLAKAGAEWCEVSLIGEKGRRDVD